MLKTIPVINNKGGVGKTTTAINVAAGLARRDQDVLLVDLDSQGSASVAFGVDQDDLRPSSADVLFDNCTIGEAIRSTNHENLDLLTGSLELANADIRLKQMEQGQKRLLEVLAQVRNRYQTILIDCAPSTSILSINALVAADAFVIPVTPSYLALEGVVSLGKVVRKVRRGMGEAAPVLGIAVTMADRSEDQVPTIIEELRRHYGGKVFDTEIRKDTKLEESPMHTGDIFRYASESDGATDYARLIDELEERRRRYESVYDRLQNQKKSTARSRRRARSDAE